MTSDFGITRSAAGAGLALKHLQERQDASEITDKVLKDCQNTASNDITYKASRRDSADAS